MTTADRVVLALAVVLQVVILADTQWRWNAVSDNSKRLATELYSHCYAARQKETAQ